MDILERVYSVYCKSYRVTTDSRKVTKGDVFIALKGENVDGNSFALQAISGGAAFAVVDNPNLKGVDGCLYTNDSLSFLQALARYHREKLSIPVIGLTGSNGKTTTKELIRQVLASKYRVYATQGNLNNHIGVPLTILSITPDIEIAVVEMGANHIGEIELLCSIAKPNYGLITNIGKAHIGGFGGFEGVVKAKSELYGFLSLSGGTVFVNSENQILAEKLAGFNLMARSIDYSPKVYGARIIPGREPFLTVSLSFAKGNVIINSSITGAYNLENILAACGIGAYFGIEPDAVKLSIEEYTPSNSRSQVIDTNFNRVVLDAYNANPSSMEVALTSFGSIPSEKAKVVMLGEMLELGEYADDEHARIAQLALGFGFETVIFVGSLFPKNIPGTKWFSTSKDCAAHFASNQLKNKLILVKGSRGTKMEEVMGVL